MEGGLRRGFGLIKIAAEAIVDPPGVAHARTTSFILVRLSTGA